MSFANFVDRANVWVIQRGGCARFAAKAFNGLRIAGKLLGKKFQPDKSPKFEILGLVDHTHTAAAELLDDSVMGNRLADHVGTLMGQGVFVVAMLVAA